jgi:hypothetical protein
MKVEPVAFIYDGRSMVPLDRYRELANRQFRAGTVYALIPHRDRSSVSHRHMFASIKKGFDNIPEALANRWKSPDHLRKWCLIQEGYADELTHICANVNEAKSTAALIQTIDEYAVIKRTGNILTIWTAQSQDENHMGHDEFQESKTKILERIASMCGISLEELTKNAKETT